MNRRYSIGGGGKSSCSKGFSRIDRIAKILKHYCNKKFTCELCCNAGKLFTIHHLQLTKLVAFTLAETLIVMGIIGVVAALTLPNLNSSTGDKEKVAKVKKIYSNLEDAYGRATAVYGPFDEWFKNDTTKEQRCKRFGERMTEFMKVSKTCGTGDGCFSSAPLLLLDGSKMDDNRLNGLKNCKAYMYILADGTSIAFVESESGGGSYYFGRMFIDVDGPNKGKNQEGVDSFSFGINEDGNIYADLLPDNVVIGNNGVNEYITKWVIINDNMDYLKCYDELNWQTKTSCK